MSSDLAERARTRAGTLALCGWLLLEEPGPDLAERVADIPALAPLAASDAAVEFERVFLRGAAPYESVFRSSDGRRGGPIAARVADTYVEVGFDELDQGRWRVAGPDHLGLELRALAHLIATEAAAWDSDRPDEAGMHVETQRVFLADHLATWAEVALDAAALAAGDGPYAALIVAVRDVVRSEIDLVRPAPVLDTVVHEGSSTAAPMGPGRLARHLLAPDRCGLWLSTDDIARGAQRLGFPWRPMDGRSNLTPLLRAALDAGELPGLVEPWIELARITAGRHRERAETQPGAEAIWRSWEQRAQATWEVLTRCVTAGVDDASDNEVVIRLAGHDLARALAWLKEQGYEIEEIDASR